MVPPGGVVLGVKTAAPTVLRGTVHLPRLLVLERGGARPWKEQLANFPETIVIDAVQPQSAVLELATTSSPWKPSWN